MGRRQNIYIPTDVNLSDDLGVPRTLLGLKSFISVSNQFYDSASASAYSKFVHNFP